MGKPTGFLEYTRKVNPSADPLERIGNFEEFHPGLEPGERRIQAARCMNCGVPFCQGPGQGAHRPVRPAAAAAGLRLLPGLHLAAGV